MLRDQRRTKIVCTMGPASDGDILPQLLAAGMNVARLNFSHGTQAEHGARIKRLRELAAAEGLRWPSCRTWPAPRSASARCPGARSTYGR